LIDKRADGRFQQQHVCAVAVHKQALLDLYLYSMMDELVSYVFMLLLLEILLAVLSDFLAEQQAV
jgi:hypothetical protein